MPGRGYNYQRALFGKANRSQARKTINAVGPGMIAAASARRGGRVKRRKARKSHRRY